MVSIPGDEVLMRTVHQGEEYLNKFAGGLEY